MGPVGLFRQDAVSFVTAKQVDTGDLSDVTGRLGVVRHSTGTVDRRRRRTGTGFSRLFVKKGSWSDYLRRGLGNGSEMVPM